MTAGPRLAFAIVVRHVRLAVSWLVLLGCGSGAEPKPKPEEWKLPPELVSVRDELCACEDQKCIDHARGRQAAWWKAQGPNADLAHYSTHEIDACAAQALQRASTKKWDINAATAELSKVPACLAPVSAALAKLPKDTWTSDDEIKPASLDALRTAVGVELIPEFGGLKPYLDDEVAQKRLGTVAPCPVLDRPPAAPIDLAVVRVSGCVERDAGTAQFLGRNQKVYGAECHAALVWVAIAQPKVVARLAVTFVGKPKKAAENLTDAEAYKLSGSLVSKRTRELASGQLLARLKAW